MYSLELTSETADRGPSRTSVCEGISTSSTGGYDASLRMLLRWLPRGFIINSLWLGMGGGGGEAKYDMPIVSVGLPEMLPASESRLIVEKTEFFRT